ncbi:MAG: hypothetical protein P8Y79_13105, partial [Ignavibacteriaceae bacterium]
YKAHLLLVNQNNCEYWFNARNLGCVDDVLHWIRIIKPQDYRCVPSTEVTLKTISWYAAFIGSSNIESRKTWELAGNKVYPINKVSLNRAGVIKTGEVKLSIKKRYHWGYEISESRTRRVGINHDVYYKTPNGNNMINQIKATVEVGGWGSEGELKVAGDDEETKYLPEGKYDVKVNTFNTVRATVTLGKQQL